MKLETWVGGRRPARRMGAQRPASAPGRAALQAQEPELPSYRRGRSASTATAPRRSCAWSSYPRACPRSALSTLTRTRDPIGHREHGHGVAVSSETA